MNIVIRGATHDDLDSIIRLLSDDPISAGRGDVANAEDAEAYASALARIIDDPSNEIVVVVNHDDTVVGTLQLTVIPGMTRRGAPGCWSRPSASRARSARRESGPRRRSPFLHTSRIRGLPRRVQVQRRSDPLTLNRPLPLLPPQERRERRVSPRPSPRPVLAPVFAMFLLVLSRSSSPTASRSSAASF